MVRTDKSITSWVSRFAPTIGRLLFRFRSITALPFILTVICISRPTLTSASVGTIPLILGECLRIWAVGYAGGTTRSRTLGAARDLVTTGPYAHVRNPLYLGNLMLSLGICVITNVYWMVIVLIVGYFIQYLPIIASEEAYLREVCGATYQTYYNAVPRFIPRLHNYANPSPHSFSLSRALKAERRTLTAIACVVGLIVARAMW